MKNVKYIVSEGEAFGDYEEGSEHKAILLASEGMRALLFHPAEKKRGLCASLSICFAINSKRTMFKSSEKEAFINLSRADALMFERMIKHEEK